MRKRLQTKALGGPHTSGGQTPGHSSCKVLHVHFVVSCCTSLKYSARTALTRCALEYARFLHLYLAECPDELIKLQQGISAPQTSGAPSSPTCRNVSKYGSECNLETQHRLTPRFRIHGDFPPCGSFNVYFAALGAIFEKVAFRYTLTLRISAEESDGDMMDCVCRMHDSYYKSLRKF